MSSIFTDFVHAMVSGRRPDDEMCKHLWMALRNILATEMRRRGVWQTRPSFLGVIGHSRWQDAGGGSDGLDELTSDCFEFIFVRRLKGLQRQARRKSTIDGLILLAVRQFLLAAQSRNDPLGFRIFEVVSASVGQAVEDDRLTVIGGPDALRNTTYLGLHRRVAVDVARSVDLSPLVDDWVDQRLDDLVSATHRRLAELKVGLADDVLRFLDDERPGFRFGNLVSPLKEQVRRAWAARFLNLPGFLGLRDEDPADEAVLIAESLSFRDHIAAVVRCIDQADVSTLDAKTRRYLATLWGYLKGIAFEDLKRCVLESTDAETADAADAADADVLPPMRRLAKLLDIPRARFPKLFAELRERWTHCEEASGATGKDFTMATSSQDPSDAAHAEARAVTALDRALDRALHDDSAGLNADDPEPSPVAFQALVPGDLFAVPSVDVEGVDWLALAVDETTGQLHCCPADMHPLAAAGDVECEWIDPAAEPWVVRLGLEIAIPRGVPGTVERVGHLAPDLLLAVLAQRSDGAMADDDRALLPSYREWMAEGPERAVHELRRWVSDDRADTEDSAAPQPAETPATQPLPMRRVGRFQGPWMGLVAALLLVTVGLSVGLGRQVSLLNRQVDDISEQWRQEIEIWKGRVESLSQPIVNPTIAELGLDGGVRGITDVQLSEGEERFELILNSGDRDDYDRIRFDFLSPQGALLFRTDPLATLGPHSVSFPVRLFEEGTVEVRLIGLRGTEETVLETGFVRVLDGPPGR